MSTSMICIVLRNPTAKDGNLTIKFCYSHDTDQNQNINGGDNLVRVLPLFQMDRKLSEPLGDVARRIKINISKKFSGKTKNKKKRNKLKMKQNNDPVSVNVEDDTDDDNILMKFFKNGKLIENLEGIKNYEFWLDGSQIHINGYVYNVKVNYPNISKFGLPLIILVGYYVFPDIQFDIGNIIESEFYWFKSYSDDNQKEQWIMLNCRSFYYQVQPDDIGFYLKVVCRPRSGNKEGFFVETKGKNPIRLGPSGCPFERRSSYCQYGLKANEFRVVSYNLLSSFYADSNQAPDGMYAHCDKRYLCPKYRQCLLIKELISYQSDIYFLQELDRPFNYKLKYILKESLGHQFIFQTKKDLPEGLGIYFNQTIFQFIQKESHSYADLLMKNKMFENLKTTIQQQSENFINRFIDLKNFIQFVLLEWKIGKRLLLLCNLHLYSKDDADHIRLIQTYITLIFIENKLKFIKRKFSNIKTSVLLCGDFNSTPDWGIVKLIQSKYADSSFEDFKSNKSEIIKNIQLSHHLHLKSACGFPEYTHFMPTFSGCLDYIFYDYSHLDVVNVVPMPEHEDVIRENNGLPNEKIPSDHLPLICTLKWKD